jgi:hypothetical protein
MRSTSPVSKRYDAAFVIGASCCAPTDFDFGATAQPESNNANNRMEKRNTPIGKFLVRFELVLLYAPFMVNNMKKFRAI